MNEIVTVAQRVSAAALRISLGIVLLWIGALKFADPAPVVGLLEASLSFLASAGFVYVLGLVEVVAALMLLAGICVRYVGLVLVLMFAGTLTIFLIASGVVYGEHGFPYLTLAGEFLLKDLVLVAASIALVGGEGARMAER